MNHLKTRRSIRHYSDQPVDTSLLHELLTDAMHTQTMGNLQLYSVIVTRDEERKRQLQALHFNQSMVSNAPVVLTVCADFNRVSRWAEQRQATPGYNNFLSFLNAATDALLFTQTFCNLAEEQGLGCCFLGTCLYMSQPIVEALHLPSLVMPVACITLGWPDENPPVTPRLPLSTIIHEEQYVPFSPERIDNAYADMEALPENQHFVSINGKETLAQVITDLRFTEKDNLAASESLLHTLRKQGFME